MAGGRRKKNEAGPERRPAILDAAQRVLAEEGLKSATMRRIAAEAGLSTAGLYIYFKNKEAILAAIRDRTFSELHAFAQKATAGAGNPEERLRRHLAAYLDFARSYPDGYRLTFRSQLIRTPRPGRPSTPRAAVGREDFTVLVEEIAELIQADGAADEMLAHALAETAWAVIHGVSSLVIDVPNFPTSGIDRCLDEAVNMVLLGVRSHRRGPADPA